MARQGEVEDRVTGWGWVGAGGAGPEVGAESYGPGGRDAKFSGIEVGDGGVAEHEGDLAGLAVEAGWGACRVVYTLITTLVSKVELVSKHLFFCRFAVQPNSRLHLTLEVSARLD